MRLFCLSKFIKGIGLFVRKAFSAINIRLFKLIYITEQKEYYIWFELIKTFKEIKYRIQFETWEINATLHRVSIVIFKNLTM